MRAKSVTKRYEIVEANTNEAGRLTGFKAKPTPDFWDLMAHETTEYGKIIFGLAAFTLFLVLACLIFGS